jgi:hypothetical protein
MSDLGGEAGKVGGGGCTRFTCASAFRAFEMFQNVPNERILNECISEMHVAHDVAFCETNAFQTFQNISHERVQHA